MIEVVVRATRVDHAAVSSSLGSVSREALTFEVPIPPRGLEPNRRGAHWRGSVKIKRQYRNDCRVCCLAAMQVAEAAGLVAPWPFARIDYVFYYASRRGAAARDDDNSVASMKQARDGFAQAGIVTNDKRFRQGTAQILADPERPRVVVTISRLEVG